MKTTLNFLITLSAIIFIFGCSPTKKDCSNIKTNEKGQPILRLQQQWFANSGFAGEVFAQYETASMYDVQIEVLPGSDMIDSKQVVQLGEAEFGVAGAEQIMVANQEGADLVVIGVINYKSLACFISKKGKGIYSPKDMIAHKIGTMEGTPSDMIYKALKKKQNLNIPSRNEIPTSWVLTGFLKDEYDVYPGFINDEPITLKLQGYDLDIIYPANYGIDFIGTVYFCKKKLAESCPKIVQKFINSIAKGWELTIEDPNKAMIYLKKYDNDIDLEKEKESLMSGLDYYKGESNQVLFASEKTWGKMEQLLKDINELKTFDYNQSVDNRFVCWYNENEKHKAK